MEAFFSQNLLWIVLGIGALFLFSRMHGGQSRIFSGGHGGGHGGGLGGLFGGGHGGHGGGHGGGGHGEHNPDEGQARSGAPAAIDPVSRNPVDPARALSSFYGGRVYYFESAETRTKFEAAPASYASAQPSAQPEQQPSQRRRGC